MLTLLNRHPRCCCEVSREWMTMVKTSCVRSVNEWLTLNEWLWRVTFSKSDMGSVNEKCEMIYKERCKAMKSWKNFPHVVFSLWAALVMIQIQLQHQQLHILVFNTLCISNEQRYQAECLALLEREIWKTSHHVHTKCCIRSSNVMSVGGKKGKEKLWKMKSLFSISRNFLRLPFSSFFFFIFLLCFCCCVFLYAQVKFSRIGNLMGWYQREKKEWKKQ